MSSGYIGRPCPKCGHVRTWPEGAPDWQCPKCGIAYVKFGKASPLTPSESAGPGKTAGLDLTGHSQVFVTQRFEMGELFGFETRNRYRIADAGGNPIGYAAEERTGALGFLARQFLGHWRTFDIHFYDDGRREVFHASHPFRFYFTRLDVFDAGGRLVGAIEKRFSLLSKRFHVTNARGATVMEVNSPLWRIWTFPFVSKGRVVASVNKKWSGAMSELFTDRDDFQVEFRSRELGRDERWIVLAAAIYVDLTYFERKAGA
jgi:uncharacterized protein YxjI